jgi:hypothetical protein
VFDYSVSFDQATGVYVELSSGILLTSYTATTLTAGLTYKFKIQARNSHGLSEYSSEI